MSRDLVVAGGNHAVTHIYTQFAIGFETVFQFNNNGTLKCNAHVKDQVATWFNNNKIMIMLITGIDIPDLEFIEHGYRDMEAVNINHLIILQYFSFAFTAYMKYSQTIHREIQDRFRPLAFNPQGIVVVDED